MTLDSSSRSHVPVWGDPVTDWFGCIPALPGVNHLWPAHYSPGTTPVHSPSLFTDSQRDKIQQQLNELSSSFIYDSPSAQSVRVRIKLQTFWALELLFAQVFNLDSPFLLVIDGLDRLKKENAGARDGIRFLESEFRKGNRWVKLWDETFLNKNSL